MNQKKLYCVVVSDPHGELGLDSPVVFHVKSESQDSAEIIVSEELLGEDYDYDKDDLAYLDMFTFEVTELDIIER
jgi:hypothetical protein